MRRRKTERADLYALPSYRDVVARVAANVRRLRADQGLTQEECAHRCHEMPVTLLRLVESGKTNVTALTLGRLSEGLQVDVMELLRPAAPLAGNRGVEDPEAASVLPDRVPPPPIP